MTTRSITYGEPTVWELKRIDVTFEVNEPKAPEPPVDPDDETDEDLVSPKNDEVPT